jgi:hypothetical protein
MALNNRNFRTVALLEMFQIITVPRKSLLRHNIGSWQRCCSQLTLTASAPLRFIPHCSTAPLSSFIISFSLLHSLALALQLAGSYVRSVLVCAAGLTTLCSPCTGSVWLATCSAGRTIVLMHFLILSRINLKWKGRIKANCRRTSLHFYWHEWKNNKVWHTQTKALF